MKGMHEFWQHSSCFYCVCPKWMWFSHYSKYISYQICCPNWEFQAGTLSSLQCNAHFKRFVIVFYKHFIRPLSLYTAVIMQPNLLDLWPFALRFSFLAPMQHAHGTWGAALTCTTRWHMSCTSCKLVALGAMIVKQLASLTTVKGGHSETYLILIC